MIPLCACLPFASLNTERHQTSPEFVQMCQARLDVEGPKSSKITLSRQKYQFQQTTTSKLAIFHPPKTWVVFEESCPPKKRERFPHVSTPIGKTSSHLIIFAQGKQS